MGKITRALNTQLPKNFYIATVTPALIFLTGVAASLGWCFEIEFLTSLKSDWVTMKFFTATGLALLGGMMIAKRMHSKIFLFGFLIASITWLATSWAVGDPACFLPSFETHATMTVSHDYPSLASMLLFTVSGWSIVQPKKQTGIAIIAISGFALLGYLLDVSWMYYYIPGVSTAIAFHTAVAFMHVGVWTIAYSKNREEKECKHKGILTT